MTVGHTVPNAIQKDRPSCAAAASVQERPYHQNSIALDVLVLRLRDVVRICGTIVRPQGDLPDIAPGLQP